MNTQVQLFNYNGFGNVRTTVDESGEPLFCLSDVCKILELRTNKVVQRLSKDVLSKYPLLTSGGNQVFSFVNEDGLYDVILDSRKPEAKAFRKWVTSEVLPSIRKDGGYIVAKADDSPEVIMARAILLADKTIKKQQEKIEMQSKQIADLERKTEYLRLIEATPGYVNINQIAQDYGWSAIRMNRKLHELGIQYYQGGQWILYAKYKDKGYVKSRTVVCEDGEARMHTKWSQRGRRFIYEELRKELILPTCELY